MHINFLPRKERNSKLPEDYKSIEGWLSDEVAELLFEKSKSLTGKGAIVEIGSWKGRSTVCLAAGSQAGNCPPIYAIDTHNGSQEHQQDGPSENTLQKFQGNIRKTGYQHLVHPLNKTSEEAAQNFNQSVELLWIDGSHEYPDVLNDFQLWFPKVIPGGWILFHDSKWPGVKRVLWEEFFTRNDLGIIRRIEDTTFAQKKKNFQLFSTIKNRRELALLQLNADHKWIYRQKRRQLTSQV